MRIAGAACVLILLAGCAHGSRRQVTARALPPLVGPAVELGESWPLETTLDHPEIPDAADVWLRLVRGARRSIDFAEFYASNQSGSRLDDIINALETAAANGVAVRFLAEDSFAKRYPETLTRLAKNGITVRRFAVGKVMGGILHAKYFIVDGREAWVGSQNFDWRSLVHIQELGVRIREPSMVKALVELYEADWDVADGAGASRYADCRWPVFPVKDGEASLTVAASPKGFLCGSQTWDLPMIVRWIDEAKVSVKVQLLTYKAKNRDGTAWPELDDALRRAAARGVKVHVVVSSWNMIEPSLTALTKVPNAQVSVLTIPSWSGGEIPFARVVHSKFMVVDGVRLWIGTSNWEGDYFTKTRNVSVFVEGGAVPSQVERIFDGAAASTYATPYQR